MRSFKTIGAVIMLVVALGHAAGAQASAAPGSTPEILRHLYQRFLDGMRRRDTTAYRELLTPDYVFVGDSGVVVRDRSTRLKRDMQNPDRYDVFAVERCELALHGSTAVGPCWYHAQGISSGRRGDWHGISLLTFVHTADGWRIAAARPSLLRPKE